MQKIARFRVRHINLKNTGFFSRLLNIFRYEYKIYYKTKLIKKARTERSMYNSLFHYIGLALAVHPSYNKTYSIKMYEDGHLYFDKVFDLKEDINNY